KAPGLSGIATGMIRQAIPVIGTLLASVYTLMLETGDIPKAWLWAVMHPIAKDREWNGNLDRVRPIMLLDTLRKVFMAIITDRFTHEIERCGVMSPWNVGFRRDLCGQDNVMMIRAMRDLAEQQGVPLYFTQ